MFNRIHVALIGILTYTSISTTTATVTGGLITGGSALARAGVFQKLSPPLPNRYGAPNSVGQNTFNDPNLYAFDEAQNVLLIEDLAVDILATTGRPGILPAGTEVASHYVFFDPVSGNMTGYVDFNAEILAILDNVANLKETDPLINPKVHYLSPGKRGLEGRDAAQIDPEDPMRLLLVLHASSPGDYIRVLTRHAPMLPDEVIVPAASDPWLSRRRSPKLSRPCLPKVIHLAGRG